MVRIVKMLSSSRLVQRIADAQRIELVLLFGVVLLAIAALWTKFFFVVVAGLAGAAAGYKLNEAFKTGNPFSDRRRLRGIRRSTVDLLCFGVFLALACAFFLQGIFQPDGNFVSALLYTSIANGLFAFGVSYYAFSVIRLDQAKHMISTAGAEQSLIWEQEARRAKTKAQRVPFYRSWFEA